MSYVIPNEHALEDVFLHVFGNWKPDAMVAVLTAIRRWSQNIRTAEDMRMLMVASPSKAGTPARPTLWIPFCEAVQNEARVFDQVAQHNLKIKLMDKANPTVATPEPGLADAGGSSTGQQQGPPSSLSPVVNLSLRDLCSLLQGGAGRSNTHASPEGV